MSGLSLRTGISAGGTIGSYTPMTPAAASSPSANIAQQAYGISGTGGSSTGPARAAVGSVSVGVVALAALIYLWWSLPR